LSPTTPQNAAGWRIEPPVSVPSDHGAMPAATAAAEPPEEPPGTRVGSQGLRVGPYAECSVEEPIANSSMLDLPSETRPAACVRSTTSASQIGRKPARMREPAVVGTSRVEKRSFSTIGTPATPLRPARSRARARSSVASGWVWRKTWSSPSSAAMRSR
jgi:hypothetical protein